MAFNKRVKIKTILEQGLIGSEITLMGWVRTKRSNKNVSFIAMNDGSIITNYQVVADPNVISSIMGLFKPSFVSERKERRIKWFATVTSVGEAIIAEEAGADALVVQGSEAGGHRGNFCTDYA